MILHVYYELLYHHVNVLSIVASPLNESDYNRHLRNFDIRHVGVQLQ